MSISFAERISNIVGEDSLFTDLRNRRNGAVDSVVTPPLLKPFAPIGIPGMVVRPKTEEQIIELIRASHLAQTPLVVRGGATSRYGGVLPRRDATVLDLSDCHEVVSVRPEKQEVCCQAGATWQEVARELKQYGFELRLYPSSYPLSTVGGWLAQGGIGFGSYEYGAFKENVVSARVIFPTGEVRTMCEDELLLFVADAEGITGVITEVTFKIKPLEEIEVRLISYASASDLNDALENMVTAKLPLWSITFINPSCISFKKELPVQQYHAHKQAEVEEEVSLAQALPETYLVMLVFSAMHTTLVQKELVVINRRHGGTMMSNDLALQKWSVRGNSLRLKRRGYCEIPAEITVPLCSLGEVLSEIEEKIRQPFVLEGIVARDKHVALLGYIPHNEHSFSYSPAFTLSFSVVSIAHKHEGSCYSTGLYYRQDAERILGEEKCECLRAFKRNLDPRNIMNPGKVLVLDNEPPGALTRFFGMATRHAGLFRPFANAAKPKSPRSKNQWRSSSDSEAAGLDKPHNSDAFHNIPQRQESE